MFTHTPQQCTNENCLTLSPLYMYLFGGVTIQLEYTVTSAKAQALFIYLACQPRPHPRDVLADLLFPTSTPARARSNLRTLVSRLGPLTACLQFTTHTIALHPQSQLWIDASAFDAQVTCMLPPDAKSPAGTTATASDLEAALSLYQGPFLDGFTIRDAPQWEQWVILERERYHQAAIIALNQLINYYFHKAEYPRGMHHAFRLLQLDPLSEDGYASLMRGFLALGQPVAAQAQFDQCCHILRDELGVAPGSELLELYQQSLHPDTRVAQRTITSTTGHSRPHRLPELATPCLGREQEQQHISTILIDPTCRVVSLVGMGGVGKSHMALASAWQVTQNPEYLFPHGIFWVSLVGVDDPQQLATTIARTLDIPLDPATSTEEQLGVALSQRSMLIILDNIEHLLGATTTLTQILQAAPKVKFLVTTRRRLNLQHEWVLPLSGLAYPSTDVIDSESYPAMQVLLGHIRRQNPTFPLSSDQRNALVTICRILAGVPLGLLLAATWVPAMSCVALAAALTKNLNLLNTTCADMAVRHRSLRAVFMHSWNLLTPAERTILQRLSVFRGSFTHTSATHITCASVQEWTSLIQHSLLQTNDTDRWSLHLLVKQFAAEQLAMASHEETMIRARHARHYLRWLIEQQTALCNTDAGKTLSRLEHERENISTAWRWMVSQQAVAWIDRALDGVFEWLYRCSAAQEGTNLLEEAIMMLRHCVNGQATLARVLTRQSVFLTMLGKTNDARTQLETSATIIGTFSMDTAWQVEQAFIYQIRGAVEAHIGDYTKAKQAYSASLAWCTGNYGSYCATDSLAGLVRVYSELGQHQTAYSYAVRSLAQYEQQHNHLQAARMRYRLSKIAEDIGDRIAAAQYLHNLLPQQKACGDQLGLSRTLNALADLAAWQEDYDQALHYYNQSISIQRTLGLPKSIAITLGNIGTIYHVLGDHIRAYKYYQQSLTLSREIVDRLGEAYMLCNLGELADQCGARTTAQVTWAQALECAVKSAMSERLLHAVGGIAILMSRGGDPVQAVALLLFVQQHPACSAATKDYIANALASISINDTHLTGAHTLVAGYTLEVAIAHCWTYLHQHGIELPTDVIVSETSNYPKCKKQVSRDKFC